MNAIESVTPAPSRELIQRQRLRQMQWTATGLLLLAAALWIAARTLGHGQGPWAYVAAFAEAAMIGGLADWFAVVALFRRPLGLPIWHTAILPNRKDDVARNLGEFVETHLVTPEALRERLPRAELARRLAEALEGPAAAPVAGWLAEFAPRLVRGLDDERVAAWLAECTAEALDRLDASRLTEQGLRRLLEEGLHQRLLDGVAGRVATWLEVPEHLPAISDFLAQAMNIDNPMIKSMVKAAAPKAVSGLVALLADLQDREDHPWRGQLDHWANEAVGHLHDNRIWHARIRRWQEDALQSRTLRDWLQALWPQLKARLEQRLADDPAALAASLTPLVEALGRQLTADPALLARLDDALVGAAASLSASHRGAAARFLESQLARWSADEMSEKVELAIGRDLQFIRVNGTLVGGLIGLALHALAQL